MRIHLTILAIAIGLTLVAQSKYLAITTPGTLSSLISTIERTSITTLTLSGNIDARDFVFMRDKMDNLSILNLGNVSIKSYTGTEGTYKNSNKTYAANSIPDYAFYDPSIYLYKPSLTSLVLPATLVSIGKQAFYFNWNLAGTITLPASVTSIGDLAFYGCYALESFSITKTNSRYSTNSGILYSKSADTLFICPNAKSGIITLPSTVKHIYSSAFENCYNLNSITLPASLESVGKYGFANCAGINGTLYLPSSLKKIEDQAFYSCYNLNGSIEIPASLTDIGWYCFLESNFITAYNVNSINSKYKSDNGSLYSKNMDTLFICPPTKTGTFTIPETVQLIGSHAFYNCSSLSGTINIPAKVDYIGYYAFYGTKNLSAFSVDTQNKYFSTSNSCLYSLDKTRLLAVPSLLTGSLSFESPLKQIDPAAMNNSNITGELSFSSELEWIGEYAFYNCTGISGFNIDSNNAYFTTSDGIVFNKGMDTLWICPLSKKGSYDIPGSVKYIGISAFDGCSALTQINFPSTLKQIDNFAFEYCSGLGALNLPATLDSIGNGAFYNCIGLQTINASMIYPPVINYYTLDQVNKSTCILNIPTSTLTRYKGVPYWKEFTSTNQTLFNTGIVEHKSEGFEYKTFNKHININSASASTVRIYSLQGFKLYEGALKQGSSTIYFPYKGIFILEIGAFTEKIILL